MGYMHIQNLYKNIEIMNLKRCFSTEKVHGTSANVGLKDNQPKYFAGGMKYDTFVSIPDFEGIENKLLEQFKDVDITIYGEAYGGKQQKMSETYGQEPAFIVFDVKIDGTWLNVPNAHDVATKLGLEFVPYVECSTDLEVLDAERDKPSEVAIRRGCGNDKEREGVVLRPLVEMTRSNGKRIIVKHKGDKFRETKTTRKVDPLKLGQLTDAKEIAEEWATEMRLSHILDKIPDLRNDMTDVVTVIKAMKEDIIREAGSEIIVNKFVIKSLSNKTSELYKKYISKM